MTDQLAEVLARVPNQEVYKTFIQEYFRTQRYAEEVNHKKIALDAKVQDDQISFEREKLLTPEDRQKFQREKDAKIYSEKLTEWSDCKCSWFASRVYRQGIENQLIALTAVNNPDKVNVLRDVFDKSQCGKSQFKEVQDFLAHLN